MARIAEPEHDWDRSLPMADLLQLAELFPELIGTTDPAPLYKVDLPLNEHIKSKTLAELRSDLAGVTSNEIRSFSFGYGDDSFGATIWLSGVPIHDGRADGKISLRVAGPDPTKVYGIFTRLERSVERAFAALDEYEVGGQAASPPHTSISIGNLTVGNGSVAISATGDAIATGSGGAAAGTGDAVVADRASVASDHGNVSTDSHDTAQRLHETEAGAAPVPWWQNIWLVTIVGGAIAAIVAAVLISVFG